MMGGKSSSSTSQNTQTSQVDRRIGATDNAIVVANEGDNVEVNLTDHGAVSSSIALIGDAFDKVIGLGSTAQEAAYEAITKNREQTDNFINELRVDSEERIVRLTTQWAGAALIAFILMWGYRRAK